MPMLDLLTQSYPTIAEDQNQAEITNMYLELDQAKGKYKVVAYPMPGLTLLAAVPGQNEIRDMLSWNDVLYVIAGNGLYTISEAGAATLLFSLNTSSGFAKMKVIAGGGNSNGQIIAIDGTNGYAYNIDTAVATVPITSIGFPQNAIDIENQDDIVVAVPANSIQWNISDISDTTTWDALNFASKIGQPDQIHAVVSHESMLWLMGDKTTEIWYNAGNELFPFQRVSTTFLHYGIGARDSIAVNGNYFCFLATNRGGGYTINQVVPKTYYYNPTPISTPPIETLVTRLGNTVGVEDAIGDIVNIVGHDFYTITFPAADQTLVYDVPKGARAEDKGAWYYRKSFNTATQEYGRFLGNNGAFCYGKQFVGDYASGNIYILDDQNYTENGTPILREFISPPGPTYFEGKRVYFDRLQIDVETNVGVSKTFDLSKSVDNGDTWQLVGTYTIPPKGGRIYVTRLGQSRYGMLFKLSTTMDANFCLLGFQVEARLGAS